MSHSFEEISLEWVEPYSWGTESFHVVLVINPKIMDSKIFMTAETCRGYEAISNLILQDRSLALVTGYLVLEKSTIYWDMSSLKSTFANTVTPSIIESILSEYKSYEHKCY